jgi:ABC-type nickel/cobalt efflux system permease component RcnA
MIFYILVFGLLAVLVVVLGVMRMRGRRPEYASHDDSAATGATHRSHPTSEEPATDHHHHTTEAARRSRKAKRVESRRDRRKRK